MPRAFGISLIDFSCYNLFFFLYSALRAGISHLSKTCRKNPALSVQQLNEPQVSHEVYVRVLEASVLEDKLTVQKFGGKVDDSGSFDNEKNSRCAKC